jgi:hypothetical protein
VGVTGDYPEFGLRPWVGAIQQVEPDEAACSPYTEGDAEAP